MTRPPLRLFLLTVLLAGLALLPGSEGWAGPVAEGDRLASQHRLLSALGQYDRAAQFPGAAIPAQLRLGRGYLRRGQPSEAADAFRRAEAAGARDPRLFLGLAEAQDRMGDPSAGLAALRRGLGLRPDDAALWAALVERAAHTGLLPPEIRGLLPASAVPAGEGVVGQRIAYLLGACLLDPVSGEGAAALRRAVAGPDAGVRNMARELLEATAVSGAAGDRPVSVARALLAQGLVGPALGQLEAVERGDLREAEAWALRGQALRQLGRLDQGEEALRRSLALAPEDPLGRFLLGSLLRIRGDSEGAAGQLARLAQAREENPALYVELADALVDLGDYGEAEQALRQAVEVAPEDAALRLAVARFYVDRQYRVEVGLAEAEQAVRLSGRSAEALGALSWALHLLGRSQEALEPAREAVAGDPESPLLRYRLGSIYEGLGLRELAREQYLMVEELDGTGVHGQRARAALEGR